MIKNPEYALRAATRQRVKQRGCEIQEQHRGGEHARAYDSRRTSALVCDDKENRGGSQCREQAEAVADTVGNLLCRGLWSTVRSQAFDHRCVPYMV